MIEFFGGTAIISIIVVITMLLYKLAKLKSFLITASKLLFSLLIPWIGFLIFTLFFDRYDQDILILAISITLFMALLGYAIHSKQLRSYLKSVAWIIGTPIFLIVTYIIVAIVTHDPIVPRPLTVHQLLTGYNIVYTHDGKLYQNEEYVMDQAEIYGNTGVYCSLCFYGQVDLYGYMYLNLGYGRDSLILDINTKEITPVAREEESGIEPILDMKNTFSLYHYGGDNRDLYVRDEILKDHVIARSNNAGMLAQGYGTKDSKGRILDPQKVTKDFYRKNYDNNKESMTISYDSILNSIIPIFTGTDIENIRTWNYDIQFIGVIDGLPILTVSVFPHREKKYILQGGTVVFSSRYDAAQVHNNKLYIFSNQNVFQDGNLVASGIRGGNILDEICRITTTELCLIDNTVYKLSDILEGYHLDESGLQEAGFYGRYHALIDEGLINNIGSLDYMGKNNRNKLRDYNKYIQTLIGYRYYDNQHEDFRYKLLRLSRTTADHHLNTDTIFLRPFHDSGREYSETMPLISGIDNFFGIYPVTPPESTDPNADINVGQLLMDTYFPKEATVDEEIDQKALLFELLKQREDRLNQLSGSEIE